MTDKPKNAAAAQLARARWAKTTKEERSAYARKIVTARWAKAKVASTVVSDDESRRNTRKLR